MTLSITAKPAPTSSVRRTSEQAGAALVEQKLVTQDELNAIFKNPTISTLERMAAQKLVGRLRGAIELGHFDARASTAVDAFAKATDQERDLDSCVRSARAAFELGVIDAPLFARVTRHDVGLRAKLDVFRRFVDTGREVHRLAPIVAQAGDDARVALDARLTFAKREHEALKGLVDSFGGPLSLARLRGETSFDISRCVSVATATVCTLLAYQFIDVNSVNSAAGAIGAIGTLGLLAGGVVYGALERDAFKGVAAALSIFSGRPNPYAADLPGNLS